MGPQHPSAHGVLHLILELQGEKVVGAVPDIGYLHRGTEKIAENLLYAQFVPYTDRLDYFCAMSNNLAYVLAVEKLLDIESPERAQYIRVICAELSARRTYRGYRRVGGRPRRDEYAALRLP